MPVTDTEEAQRDVLRAVLGAILAHPVAAQAGYAALVAEGRRYAATPEGKAWLSRLEGTAFVDRLRLVWESASLGALEESQDVAVPSALVETFVSIAARGDLERFLAGWMLGAPTSGERP